MNLLEYEATNHEAVRSYQLWYNYPSFYTTERDCIVEASKVLLLFAKRKENMDPFK